jgi:hypothetical protein
MPTISNKPRRQRLVFKDPDTQDDLTRFDVNQIINQEVPLVVNCPELVDRIYGKYPFLSKKAIAHCINLVFLTFRDVMILGAVLSVPDLSSRMRFMIRKSTKTPKPPNKLTSKTHACYLDLRFVIKNSLKRKKNFDEE